MNVKRPEQSTRFALAAGKKNPKPL